jgi:long-chain acyl-CoA synthetase
MYHSAPPAYGMVSAWLGLSIVLQPRFDAEDMLRLIDKHRVSHMHIVPTMFVRLLCLPAEYDLSSLRWITHGAAPCAPAVKRETIDWWGPMINKYYGATESGIVVWHNSVEALKKPGTVGRVRRGRNHAHRRRARPRCTKRGRRDRSARTAAVRFHL